VRYEFEARSDIPGGYPYVAYTWVAKALTVVVYDPAVLDLVGPPGRALREELLAAVCGNGDGDELAGRRASLGQRHRLAG
jgi:hypothetical protein